MTTKEEYELAKLKSQVRKFERSSLLAPALSFVVVILLEASLFVQFGNQVSGVLSMLILMIMAIAIGWPTKRIPSTYNHTICKISVSSGGLTLQTFSVKDYLLQNLAGKELLCNEANTNLISISANYPLRVNGMGSDCILINHNGSTYYLIKSCFRVDVIDQLLFHIGETKN